jgi:hypothetical protein
MAWRVSYGGIRNCWPYLRQPLTPPLTQPLFILTYRSGALSPGYFDHTFPASRDRQEPLPVSSSRPRTHS